MKLHWSPRSPFVRKVMVAAIEKGTRHPSLSPTDGRGYCQCPACKAQDDQKAMEPSSGTVAVTNRYLDFFDWVGKRVGMEHPESVLSFYCYADYTQPPTVPRKLDSNMAAMIAPIRYCRLHPVGHPGCASREQQVEMTNGWAAVASKLGYYNYMYNLADGTLPLDVALLQVSPPNEDGLCSLGVAVDVARPAAAAARFGAASTRQTTRTTWAVARPPAERRR
jgi:hypothetical protein